MKKKHPEHVNLERWLVSYADFITLLFAFFVVMYAISQADMAKFKKVTASIKKAFSAGGPLGMVELGGNAGGTTANLFQSVEPPGGRVHDMPAGLSHTAADRDPQLQEIRELLEETISLELGATDTSEKLQMQYDSRGLIVRVATNGFFDEGEDQARDDLRPVLDRIGLVLSRTKRLIRLEGHTDPYERKNGQPVSGWELSTARATWLAKYWIKKFSLDPSKVGIAGYSSYRPVTHSQDAWIRAKNRRVEIIILNNQYEAQ